MSVQQRSLAQRRQEAFGSLQIGCTQAFHEMLEYRSQKLASTIDFSSTGHKRCHIDGGAQFPCPRTLTAAQRECAQKACLGAVAIDLGPLEKNGSLHAQQFRNVQKIAVYFDPTK